MKKREIKMGCYKITNNITECVYIGSSGDVYDRIYKYKHNNSITKKVKESIQTYGIENHKFEILCKFEQNEIDKQLLLDFEDYYILFFVKELGDDRILNSRCNDYSKWVNSNYYNKRNTGKKHSDETRKKQSDSHKGKKSGGKHYNYGKYGIEHHQAKKVNQFTKDGTFIKTWDCISDVERKIGINNGNISRCCNNKIKSAGGFKWEYLTETV